MKHISKLKTPKFPILDSSFKGERYHGLSYYLLGGTDLGGELKDVTTAVEYDNEEQVAEIINSGAQSVALGDPRVSFFDIVEQAGAKGAQKAVDSKPKPAVVQDGE